jgi:hypothetical protein
VLYIFKIVSVLTFLKIVLLIALVIDSIVYNNDKEILLHFKPMSLIFMNYSV